MTSDQSHKSRQTKYVAATIDALRVLGHATNSELLQEIRKTYPEVSATTIHRVTARLKERGAVGGAPASPNGSERYDANPIAHHHFMCTSCGNLCDITKTPETNAVIDSLQHLSNQCVFVSTLTISGVCSGCAAQSTS